MSTWQNWSGLEMADPARDLAPRETGEIVAAVCEARDRGETVRMVGTGHSFTGVAVADHTLLRPTHLTGILYVDRSAMTVTALAGTPLKALNGELERLGLSLHNMGDIAEQTLAGAIATGTHGTGGIAAGLAAQVAGFELVTGTGEVLRASETSHPDVLDLGRVALGALGVLTTVTFRVEPLFVLESTVRRIRFDELRASYDDLVAAHHHVDAHWFPHTEWAQLKAHDRLDVPVDEARPRARWRRWVDDDLLENHVLGVVFRGLDRAPGLVPAGNRAITSLIGERHFSDVAHRVFVARRDVVFREMEYALPREAGMVALAEARRLIDSKGWRISFPVEIRNARADDIALSTSYDRDTIYLAFHTHHGTDHRDYFAGVEAVLRAHDGRPHWGKLHSRTAADLAPAYPRFEEFRALRDRLDPDRVFANAYLRRVLGD